MSKLLMLKGGLNMKTELNYDTVYLLADYYNEL